LTHWIAGRLTTGSIFVILKMLIENDLHRLLKSNCYSFASQQFFDLCKQYERDFILVVDVVL